MPFSPPLPVPAAAAMPLLKDAFAYAITAAIRCRLLFTR